MTQAHFQKSIDYLQSPARDTASTLNQIRHPLLLATIAAAVMAGTIATLWYLFSFFMESDLLTFIFKPLLIAAPLAAAMVGGLMAFDFSSLDKRRQLPEVAVDQEPLEQYRDSRTGMPV
ncbi:MAG TPA: hypothetical protein VG759_21585 [Candidatus Angelobacter sp.]|jgi:hypothetical protein|nr:hypothetical protein [Candidatus Angelobacter sp.]